ncbi:hypothetical protein HPB48_011662 [Haemaphysalis longicornis]|uniref:RING-type domain-containing protein n=1 Tax=Haemaphysalis longicornis TaxID=44386 RepID=A0A9J6FYW1_HAELO|nr:hypothetical protein HPB48_011662 [Haemaphysalis longicornis]
MSATKRQLTGFGEFLDWRPLEFVGEIPHVFVCVICGVLAAFPRMLSTCSHVFCPSCYEKIASKGHVCPVDLHSFSKQAVQVLDSTRGGIRDLTVRCPNEPRGCKFVSKLSELQAHFLEQCCRGKVHCSRCGRAMPYSAVLDHYIQYCPEKARGKYTPQKTPKTSPSFPSVQLPAASRWKDLRRKRLASRLHTDSLKLRQLRIAAKGTAKVPSQKAPFPEKLNSAVTETQKTPSVTHANKPSISGTCPSTPSTTTVGSASASSDSAGNKVTALPSGFAFCYITGLTDAQSSLSTCEEVVLRSDSSRVADCAFRVHARLRRSAFGTVLVCFSLCLCGGTREAIASWLLAKEVYVVLVHPWDQSSNVRMALAPNTDTVHQGGRLVGRWDFWRPTNELMIGDLESRGFVPSGTICVAVEIE